MPVVRIEASAATEERYHLPPAKRVAGNPLQTVRLQYTDPSGRFLVGEWSSEPGCWRVAYTEEEYCRMIEGTCVITDAAGHAVTVRAGDAFVVPRGFTGTWEVVEPARKSFVIYEPGTAPG